MNVKSTPTSDDLKQRVINVKKRLPPQIVPLFVTVFPSFDTYKKRSRISNVLQLRIADEQITAKLETLAEKLESIKQK